MKTHQTLSTKNINKELSNAAEEANNKAENDKYFGIAKGFVCGGENNCQAYFATLPRCPEHGRADGHCAGEHTESRPKLLCLCYACDMTFVWNGVSRHVKSNNHEQNLIQYQAKALSNTADLDDSVQQPPNKKPKLYKEQNKYPYIGDIFCGRCEVVYEVMPKCLTHNKFDSHCPNDLNTLQRSCQLCLSSFPHGNVTRHISTATHQSNLQQLNSQKQQENLATSQVPENNTASLQLAQNSENTSTQSSSTMFFPSSNVALNNDETTALEVLGILKNTKPEDSTTIHLT